MSEILSLITIKTVKIEHGQVVKASTVKYDNVSSEHTDAVIEFLEDCEKDRRIT